MKRYVAILAVLLCATGRSSGADEPRVVELWPGKAPEEPGTIGEEKTFPSKPNKERSETIEVTRLITNVTKPTITIYRPAKEKDTGAAHADLPGRRLPQPLVAARRRGGRRLAQFDRRDRHRAQVPSAAPSR